MQVGQNILSQLGGNRFIAMTGSSNFVGRPDGLSFKVGRNAKNVTHVRVTLTLDDLYDVQFFNIRGARVNEFSPAVGIYADDLRRVFTDRTGLETSL